MFPTQVEGGSHEVGVDRVVGGGHHGVAGLAERCSPSGDVVADAIGHPEGGVGGDGEPPVGGDHPDRAGGPGRGELDLDLTAGGHRDQHRAQIEAALRGADTSLFPDQPRFAGLHQQGQLTSPAEAAARVLAWLARDDFGSEPVADVRG